MIARENPDGSVTVPMRAVADDGTTGDGVQVLSPGESGYDAALAEARRCRSSLASERHE